MKAVIYARYSSAAQNEQSISEQTKKCNEYAKLNNIEIIETYIDKEKSATKNIERRTDFLRMIVDSSKHLFDLVLVYKLDRFSRNEYDTAYYKNELKKHNVRLVSVTEPTADNPEGELLAGILEKFAQYYPKVLAVRVMDGMRENAEHSLFCGGVVPLGYTIVDKRYTINENAKYVKEIFTLFNDGHTKKEICDILNMQGVKTATGNYFRVSSLESIFDNEIYIGTYKFADIVNEDSVPAIIDKELFYMVQDKLSTRKNTRTRTTNYIPSDKVYCECGQKMWGEKAGNHFYYTCRDKHIRVDKTTLETKVMSIVNATLTDDFIDELAREVVKMNNDDNGKTLNVLKEKKSQLEKDEKLYLNLMKEPELYDSYIDNLKQVKSDLAKVTHQIMTEEQKNLFINEQEVRDFLYGILKGNYEDEEYQKDLCDVLIEKVIVKGNDADIYLNATNKNEQPQDCSSSSVVVHLHGLEPWTH